MKNNELKNQSEDADGTQTTRVGKGREAEMQRREGKRIGRRGRQGGQEKGGSGPRMHGSSGHPATTPLSSSRWQEPMPRIARQDG